MRFSGFLKETPVCKKKNAPQKYPKIPGQRTEVSAKPGCDNVFFFFFFFVSTKSPKDPLGENLGSVLNVDRSLLYYGRYRRQSS